MTRAVQVLRPAGEHPLVANGVEGFATMVSVLLVAGVVLLLWLLLRPLRRVRHAGQGRGASLEARLQELDDLHRRGVITDGEHTAARSQVLTSP